MLKVASYNIHKAIGTDRRRNPERILDVLCELDADIIALQEADMRFGSRNTTIPHSLLESHSPYRAVPLNVRSGSMGWHGNALLVRRDAHVGEHSIVHLPCLEPRGAVTADVTVNTITLRVFGMHLDLSGLWRRRQATAILHAVDTAHVPLPTILMGDMNEWRTNAGCLRDFGRRLECAPCARSFPSRQPMAQLDRIFHSSTLTLLDSGAHDSALSRKASDHLPIWAAFAPAVT